MNDDNIILRIKELQKKLNLNNKQFSELADVNKYNMSKYYSGTLKITKAVINSIIVNTEINKEWLLTGNGEMFKRSPYPELGGQSSVAELGPSYGYKEKYYEVLEENRDLNLEIKNLRNTIEQLFREIDTLKK